MSQHYDNTSIAKVCEALRADSYVRSFKEPPPLYVFTDGMHWEVMRLRNIERQLRYTELWLNGVYQAPLLALEPYREQTNKALDAFQAAARDGMTYATDNLAVAWKKHLREPNSCAIAALGEYSIGLLRESQKEGRFGTRVLLGHTIRVTYQPPPDRPPDYLELSQEFAFEEPEEFGRPAMAVPQVRIVDYVSTDTEVCLPAEHSEAIHRMIGRFPQHIRQQLVLEQGHKIEGQSKGITVLLLEDIAIAVYEHDVEAKARPLVPIPPQPKKRRSILAAFGSRVLMFAYVAVMTYMLVCLILLLSPATFPKRVDQGTSSEPTPEPTNLHSTPAASSSPGNSGQEETKSIRSPRNKKTITSEQLTDLSKSMRVKRQADQRKAGLSRQIRAPSVKLRAHPSEEVYGDLYVDQPPEHSEPPSRFADIKAHDEEGQEKTTETRRQHNFLVERDNRVKNQPHKTGQSNTRNRPAPSTQTLVSRQSRPAIKQPALPNIEYRENGDIVIGDGPTLVFPEDFRSDTYNTIMALIEPELCTYNMRNKRMKYRGQPSAQREQRMERYRKAFALYGECFQAYTQKFDDLHADRIARLAEKEREVYNRRRSRSQQNIPNPQRPW